MKRNEGGLDRGLRVLIGVGALGAGAYYQNALGLVGLIPLLTGIFGFCPLYGVLGLSTCAKECSTAHAGRPACCETSPPCPK